MHFLEYILIVGRRMRAWCGSGGTRRVTCNAKEAPDMAGTWCGKRWAAVVLGVTLAWVGGCSVSVQNHRSVVVGGSPAACRLELTGLTRAADGGPISGSWAARGKWEKLWGDDPVTIQAVLPAAGGLPERVLSRIVTADSFDGTLPRRSAAPDKPNSFSLARGAGVLRFDADPDGKPWKGPFRLELDPAYAAEAASLVSGELTPEHWMAFVVDDVRIEDLRQFRDAGVILTADDALRAIHAGLTPDYMAALRDAGYSFTLNELIDMKSQGVSADYAVGMKRAGYDFTAKELVHLKWQGVTTSYATGMKEAGYHLAAEDLVNLKWQGVSTSYAAGMSAAGYSFTPKELIDLKWQGVSTSYAAGMREAGYGFAPRELIDLKWQGVSTSYAAGMKQAGYDFTPKDLIALKWQGVTTSYVAALSSPDGAKLSAREIIELRQTGVSPETIRKIRGQK